MSPHPAREAGNMAVLMGENASQRKTEEILPLPFGHSNSVPTLIDTAKMLLIIPMAVPKRMVGSIINQSAEKVFRLKESIMEYWRAKKR